MRFQANRDYVSNDDVQTPPPLARLLVEHLQPCGRILEPCRGDGNFHRALQAHVRSARRQTRGAGPITRRSKSTTVGSRPRKSSVAWTEIKAGRDFFAWTEPVDWIVTNPPWSEIRRFLQHAMELADHVVFLLTINHVWTKARLRDIAVARFGIKEIVLVTMPTTFPQSGFQLGAVYLQRGWKGPITLTDLQRGTAVR